MDARTDRPADPDPGRIEVRVSDIGELAASIPHLLGFRPRESVVLISLGGPSGGRVGLTARIDIPPPVAATAMVREVVRTVLTDEPHAVVVAVVSEAPDPPDGTLAHQEAVAEVGVALAAHAVPVQDAVLVRGGRWWSYDCAGPCCAPGRGTPLPEGVSALEVAAVASGAVVECDREALAARIAAPGPEARTAIAETCARTAGALADDILRHGWAAVAAQSWSAVLAAVDRVRPGTPADRLTDVELARLLWGLRDVAVRDRALELALGEDAAAAEQLWTECTRRAPAPLDAAPATLLAVSTWLRGDGAMAGIALARALDGAPDYALARLLAQGLSVCMRPAELRALIEQAAGDRSG
ncbi:DUF4192 domain-containing protein [Blastococcus tunisiensis]|uniref:DUF4192 domain-containing protein n=1 Tax=Blastococcus tunisiensis TaxID=1798228 RepID=A0A1I2LFV8_9ACTN|nr:DUF4192 domain-containing protein [Blastococcus sp. DSM 46838]SFF76021.1 protein of unknown function [Blastococcus sp. DSM 46838]